MSKKEFREAPAVTAEPVLQAPTARVPVTWFEPTPGMGKAHAFTTDAQKAVCGASIGGAPLYAGDPGYPRCADCVKGLGK